MEIESKSWILMSDKEKATAMPSQITAELKIQQCIKIWTLSTRRQKKKRLQLANLSFIFSSLTPYQLIHFKIPV